MTVNGRVHSWPYVQWAQRLRLGHGSQSTLLAMALHVDAKTGNQWASYATLGGETGRSARTVQRDCRHLETLGLITFERYLFDPETGHRTSCVYHLNLPAIEPESSESSQVHEPAVDLSLQDKRVTGQDKRVTGADKSAIDLARLSEYHSSDHSPDHSLDHPSRDMSLASLATSPNFIRDAPDNPNWQPQKPVRSLPVPDRCAEHQDSTEDEKLWRHCKPCFHARMAYSHSPTKKLIDRCPDCDSLGYALAETDFIEEGDVCEHPGIDVEECAK
jgi:hypothetical protein